MITRYVGKKVKKRYKQDRGFLGDIFCSSFCFFLTLVRLGSLHNKSLFVMTVNHDQIQLSLDPLFLLSLPSSSFFIVGNKHSIY